MWRRQRKVSATARKMELLKLGLLMEALINFESTFRFTVFFLSVRRRVVNYRNDFPRPTTTIFFVVLNVEAFTLILLITYPSPKLQFCLK